MEEGPTGSRALLKWRGVNFDCIVTDRRPQVQKDLRERNNLLLRCLALMLSLPLLECCAGKIKFVYLILLGIVAKTVNINILFCTSRLYLAATHSNENADRPQAETEEGVPLNLLSKG